MFEEYSVDNVDFLTHIPNSPIDAAIGYAEASGLRREKILYKSKPTRTFIGVSQDVRDSNAENVFRVNDLITPETHSRKYYL